MPARFVREMLCLRRSRGRLRRAASCPSRARFDVLAHHPYSVGATDAQGAQRDDVSIPDVGKLTRLLRAAERLGGRAAAQAPPHVGHRGLLRLRAARTHTACRSRPHARFLEQAFYLLWKQGVDTITWFQIRDQLPNRATPRRCSRASTSPTAARSPRSARSASRSSPSAPAARVAARVGPGARRGRGADRAAVGVGLAPGPDGAGEQARHLPADDRHPQPDEHAGASRRRDQPHVASHLKFEPSAFTDDPRTCR